MAQQVVTELVIDSSRAVAGANEYTRAMDGAQSAMQRTLGAMSDGIADVRDGIAGMGQAATNIIPTFGQVTVALGATAAIVLALSKAAQEFAHGLADMGSAARRAGVDVESFQKLQFAASLEGLANKDFSSGIEKMALRLNDASRNENELSKLLDANNVKFKDANGILISTTSLLEKARDLISRAANEQDKIKMAEMLGLTKEWVPLLDKSAQAFAATQTEATRLGLVIDASTIKKAEEFDREWRKSSTVFSTWMKAQLAELLPVLDELIAKSVLFGKSVMDAFAAAISSPEAQEISTRARRAEQILGMVSSDNTVKENADIVTAAGRAMLGILSEQTKALLDQKHAADQTAKMWNDISAGWENAAAAGQALIKSMPNGAANDNRPRSIVPAKDVTESKDALDRAIDSVKRHTEVTLADADAQGLGAQALAEFRTIANLVTAAERAGIDVTGELGEKFAKLATEAGEAARSLAQAKISSDIDFKSKTVLLGSQDIQIALQLRSIYGNDVPAALASSEAAQIRLNDAIREARDNGIEFTKTMVKGLLDQKAGADALSNAFKALSIRLADKAIEQLLSGEFEKAAVSAISAVVTWIASLVSHTNDLKSTIDVLDRLNRLRMRQVQAQADTSTLEGQLSVFNANAILEIIEEQRKGGQLLGALLQVQADERLRIERDFQKRAAELEAQAAEQRLARQLSAQDRLFAATNDTTTLQGQLAEFDRQASRERADEIKAGGQAMVDLEAAQAAERLSLMKKFNDEAIEETKRAEQERIDALNQSARSIVDYINGLMGGPGSTLSPNATLANAQATYNANLSLAQGGNLAAQQKFVELADNLEKAARAVYASGQGYQDIRNQIISQGLALPAVQASTDPVVQAIRDSITAIQATTLAVQSGTTDLLGALDANHDGIISQSEALNFIKVASEWTRANTDATWHATYDTKLGVGDVKTNTNTTATNVDNLDASGSVLAGINNSATRVVNAINSHGAMSQSAFLNFSDHLAHIRGGTDWVATHVTQGGFVGAGAAQIAGAVGGWSYTAAAAGGVIPPFGLGLVSEHLNPTFLRAGPEPIHVFPGAPSNDNNSALLARIDRLTAKVEELQEIIAGSDAMTRQALENNGDKIKDAVEGQTGKLASNDRNIQRQRKVANG